MNQFSGCRDHVVGVDEHLTLNRISWQLPAGGADSLGISSRRVIFGCWFAYLHISISIWSSFQTSLSFLHSPSLFQAINSLKITISHVLIYFCTCFHISFDFRRQFSRSHSSCFNFSLKSVATSRTRQPRHNSLSQLFPVFLRTRRRQGTWEDNYSVWTANRLQQRTTENKSRENDLILKTTVRLSYVLVGRWN